MDAFHAPQDDGPGRKLVAAPCLEGLPPADLIDPVVEAYKKDVDRSLVRANLALTVEERREKLRDLVEFLDGVRSSRGGTSGGIRPRP